MVHEDLVSAKYSCGFPDPQVLPIIVVERYLDYFTTIMEDRSWQVLAKPVFRWRDLKDYAEYVDRVRKYARELPLSEAVERAISECIQEGVLKEFLEKNRVEVKKMSIYEYDQEKHIRMERQDAWEDGMQEGVLRGAEQQLSKIIKNMMKKGRSISQIAEELGEDEKRIRELAEKLTE